MKRLIEIQQKLKAPKNQYNGFGKYKYRSCEDILQAVKPLLAEQKLALILSDEVVCEGDREYSRANNKNNQESESMYAKGCRFYIRATAKLFDEDGKIIAQSCALAREEEEKKGMDGSQITGTASSYARKYALNGLFAIDDGIDSDTTNTGETKQESKSKPRFNEPELDNFTQKASEYGTFEKGIAEIKKYYQISKEMEGKVKKLYENLETIKK